MGQGPCTRDTPRHWAQGGASAITGDGEDSYLEPTEDICFMCHMAQYDRRARVDRSPSTPSAHACAEAVQGAQAGESTHQPMLPPHTGDGQWRDIRGNSPTESRRTMCNDSDGTRGLAAPVSLEACVGSATPSEAEAHRKTAGVFFHPLARRASQPRVRSGGQYAVRWHGKRCGGMRWLLRRMSGTRAQQRPTPHRCHSVCCNNITAISHMRPVVS